MIINMSYANISDLNPSREDWLIQARLCRMWEAINFKNDNDIMGLEMVFVDDKVHTFINLSKFVYNYNT